MLKPKSISDAYYAACMLEIEALKPGNVHVFADGHGMTVHDFFKSAEATALVIAEPNLTVGERILLAVEATQRVVATNTNLGIILLCAPLIHAALMLEKITPQALQESLASTLAKLTVEDAQLTAKAILLAKPAGLGASKMHDVNAPISVTLLALMQAAAEYDRIAWQYANNFADIFNFGAPHYQVAFTKYRNQAWATTALFLGFLAREQDTHIVRKFGASVAKAVMQEAQQIEANYWATNNPKLVQQQLLNLDTNLKQRQLNPGTTADLTVASVLLNRLFN
ncbi:MAG TPA: triphosphoribosyl-dephospho-CoA synthase [Methylotenera sp.]|nr:triphosphoribosyl-dephospho-CoA synthase [Methylotenera sp.]HPH04849.1 triphosphoribosyl-dephospho-CoA synthase [Methylotenera sp.]HPN01413.1 triphosphoribosyl-dephospho-CoA synthase [Methylotenera sp.]